MNKENEFIDNEISTGIHDSCEKSSYSSRFLQTQKKGMLQKKVLPSRYEKSAIIIQRYWRFRQHMKRRLNEKIINELLEQNQCYELQNSILQKLITQYELLVKTKQSFFQHEIKTLCADYEQQISRIKKQCVLTSFTLQKKKPKKQLLSQLIHLKQQQKELNLMLNREKFINDQGLEEQKKENLKLIQQMKRLNMKHLELVKQKNTLTHIAKQKLLQTSKFRTSSFANYV